MGGVSLTASLQNHPVDAGLVCLLWPEDLCAFLVEQSVLTAYLHCDVKPMQRLELLRQLRSGEVAVIVGVNLLREVRSFYLVYVAMVLVMATVPCTWLTIFCESLRILNSPRGTCYSNDARLLSYPFSS